MRGLLALILVLSSPLGASAGDLIVAVKSPAGAPVGVRS